MSIQKQLESVSSDKNRQLLQFNVTKKQYQVLKVVARHWSEPGKALSISELCRRCIQLALAKIEDRSLLSKIKAIMTSEEL